MERRRSVRLFVQVLLVEPDADAQAALQHAWSSVAYVESCSDFRTASRRLLQHPPDLLVTNARLRRFNGLRLVHFTAAVALKTRSIVYTTELDIGLARETQAAGAFYERAHRLPYILSSYTRSPLPPRDRRDPALLDRRLSSYRGGRRGPEVVVAREHSNQYTDEILRDLGDGRLFT